MFDFSSLDKEHVYVFRIKQEYVDNTPKEDINKMCELLQNRLADLGVNYIVLAEDAIEITELVK